MLGLLLMWAAIGLAAGLLYVVVGVLNMLCEGSPVLKTVCFTAALIGSYVFLEGVTA